MKTVPSKSTTLKNKKPFQPLQLNWIIASFFIAVSAPNLNKNTVPQNIELNTPNISNNEDHIFVSAVTAEKNEGNFCLKVVSNAEKVKNAAAANQDD